MPHSEPITVTVDSTCLHKSVEPVTVDFEDDPVAVVCVDCHDELPPSWGCPGCQWALGPTPPPPVVRLFVLREACGTHPGERLVDDLEDGG